MIIGVCTPSLREILRILCVLHRWVKLHRPCHYRQVRHIFIDRVVQRGAHFSGVSLLVVSNILLFGEYDVRHVDPRLANFDIV